MSRYDECLKFVLRWEGSFVNDPCDHGGATNRGVTTAVYDEWRTRKGYDKQSVAKITDAEVWSIYNEQYWCPCRASVLPQPLDLAVFDAAVQHGVGRSVKWLQELVGAPIDGSFGPQTMQAVDYFIRLTGIENITSLFLKRRDSFYEHIVENDPSQVRFERGWANRMLSLRKEIDYDLVA